MRQTQAEQRKLYAIGAVVEKAFAETVETSLKGQLEIGPNIRGRLKSQGDALDCVYEPAFVDHLEGQSCLSITHFCIAEARLVLSGRGCIMALPYTQIAGDNFTQKPTILHNLTLDRAFALATKVGFLRVVTSGQLVVIPAGYIVTSATMKSGNAFLRWGLSSTIESASKSENGHAHQALADLIATYPSLGSKATAHGWHISESTCDRLALFAHFGDRALLA